MASFIFTFLAIVVALAAGGAGGYMYRKNVQEKKIGRNEEFARNLLDEAQKRAEEKKKESILEAKEEVIRLKNELDREIRDRRAEVQRSERRVTQREETLDKKADNLDARETGLERKQTELDRLTAEAQEYGARQKAAAEEAEKTAKELEEKSQAELERVAKMTQEEARDMIVQRIQKEAYHDAGVMVREIEQNAKDEAEKKARNIVAMAIQRCASRPCGGDHGFRRVPAERGHEGPHHRPRGPQHPHAGNRDRRRSHHRRYAGSRYRVRVSTPSAARLRELRWKSSSPTAASIRRASRKWSIRPQREVDNQIREAGEQAIFETNMHGIHHELVKLLGRMRYRTSYGQNVLQHSIEVSHLAGLMAAELGADVQLAKRAGLLHDIGKAVDHELEGTHVELGVETGQALSTRPPEVIHCIAAHHNDVEPQTVEAVLIQAADAISAARPGARRESIENYITPSGKAGGDFQQLPRRGKVVRDSVRPRGAHHGQAGGHLRRGYAMCSPAKLPSALKMSWNIRDRSRSTSSARPAAPSSRSKKKNRVWKAASYFAVPLFA